MTDKYVMPKAFLGPCVFYADRGAEPEAAIITAVAPGTVNLSVFAPENRGQIPKDGVRHVSDLTADRSPGYNQGFWDYTEMDKLRQVHERELTKYTLEHQRLYENHQLRLQDLEGALGVKPAATKSK